MLPGNLYLADKLIFQFRGLTQYSFIHKNMGSQNSVGFPCNILSIEMLHKS